MIMTSTSVRPPLNQPSNPQTDRPVENCTLGHEALVDVTTSRPEQKVGGLMTLNLYPIFVWSV